MATDTELPRNYAHEQSNAAFAEFVQRNLPVVYNAALRRLNGNAHRLTRCASWSSLKRRAKRRGGPGTRRGWGGYIRVTPTGVYYPGFQRQIRAIRGEVEPGEAKECA